MRFVVGYFLMLGKPTTVLGEIPWLISAGVAV